MTAELRTDSLALRPGLGRKDSCPTPGLWNKGDRSPLLLLGPERASCTFMVDIWACRRMVEAPLRCLTSY